MKSIIVILTVTSILFCIEYAIQYKLKSIKSGDIGKINAVINHDIDMEIMIWGASTAYVNINPQIMIDSLGVSVMNMGFDGTNIDQYSGLLNEFLSYSKKCKSLIIAFDVNGGLVERNQIHNSSHWVHQLDNHNISECLSQLNPKMIQNHKMIPFYSLTLYDKHILKYFKSNYFDFDKSYNFPKHGYAGNYQTALNIITENKRTIKICSRIKFKIKNICQKAISKGIKPVILITPCYISGQKKLNNLEEILQTFEMFGTNEIQVLDLHNSEISKDSSNFIDNVHLNAKGTYKFTQLIIQELNR